MKKMGLNDIREAYLKFFESKGHLRLPSFSLVPQNDPSILLINAGMTPLKPYFTGAETPPSKRVTTCQKCIRTPDIDNVGQTARHGTFFEMLGNFSFGDYFKEDAIQWAWEFCTEVLEMPPELLHATVYLDDDEAYDIWRDKVGLPESHISRFGKEDNFWEHGTGPCGPSSEIFFDRGEKYGCGSPDCKVGCECDRFVEIWNLVFTQFNKDEEGNYTPLKHKNIDTGGGLERFAVVMQDVGNLFEVDTVRAVLDKACDIAGIEYGKDHKTDVAIRVITDHIRGTVMMISDHIIPSNEGRGYVLRRLIRRAARYGRLLGIKDTFLTELAKVVIRESSAAYPELKENEERILRVILQEEKAFAATIEQGSAILQSLIERAKADGRDTLKGKDIFKLHDTYGFPYDLTREIAAEQDMRLDEKGFREAMDRQRELGRIAHAEKVGSAWDTMKLPEAVKRLPATEFTGYATLRDSGKILAMLTAEDNEMTEVDTLKEGDEAYIILDKTPFYAEAGGQVGDRGEIRADDNVFAVTQTTKTGDGYYLHRGHMQSGSLTEGSEVELAVAAERRKSIARNHTSTHLLHKALRDILGDHVEQAGSLVASDRLRFDFRHHQPVTKEELARIEEHVNMAILKDDGVETRVMPIAEARELGAMALFGEKYGDVVRVVSVGDSIELCGGTHLTNSSEAGQFRIVSESGVASGIRRIEAVTGIGAYQFTREEHETLRAAEDILKVGRDEIVPRLSNLVDEKKQLTKELEDALRAQTADAAGELHEQAEQVGDTAVVVTTLPVSDPEHLREAGDRVRDHFDNAVVVLAAPSDNKVLWLAMATKPAVEAGIHCGNLIREAAKITGGGGGGRPDMAQAGGRLVDKVDEAMTYLRAEIKRALGQ